MRRAISCCLLLACAHASRSKDPANWLELQSEHFVVRTDLAADDARRAVEDLENTRAALRAAAWHASRPPGRKTAVVELATRWELQEFAVERLEGFVASDAFGESVMVVSADQVIGEFDVLKHELAHVISEEFLSSPPRWLAEGLACYLETLRSSGGKLRVGELSRERLVSLKYKPVLDYAQILHVGREFESMDADAGYAFETASWLLVHWLVDTRPDAFDEFLARVTREPWEKAFHEAFPDLSDGAVRAGVKQYLEHGQARIGATPAPAWSGPIVQRTMTAGEVHALRADLFRLSPGFAHTAERQSLLRSEIAQALQADPGEPLAIKLSNGNAAPAVQAHPNDWRAWALFDDAASLAKAAEIDPANGPVLARLALAENNAGKRAEGLAHGLRAVQLAPGRPDVLDIVAQLQAFAGHCDEAIALEREAIDGLPDSAPPSAVRELTTRLSRLPALCAAAGVQAGFGSAQTAPPTYVKPVLKGCRVPAPPLRSGQYASAEIVATFTITANGSVREVTLQGEGSRALLAAVKRHFESCTYEPRPAATRGAATLTYRTKK